MGRLLILPDKEEVPGSNPGAPTSDLQGKRVSSSLRRRPAATILQPKYVRRDATRWDSMGPDVAGGEFESLGDHLEVVRGDSVARRSHRDHVGRILAPRFRVLDSCRDGAWAGTSASFSRSIARASRTRSPLSSLRVAATCAPYRRYGDGGREREAISPHGYMRQGGVARS
jgi:hypothetical protein